MEYLIAVFAIIVLWFDKHTRQDLIGLTKRKYLNNRKQNKELLRELFTLIKSKNVDEYVYI